MGLDIRSIVAGTDAYSSAVDAAQPKIATDYGASQALQTSNAAITQQAGLNSQIITDAANAAKLRTQQANHTVAAFLGTDVLEQGNQIAALSQDMNDAYMKQKAALDSINAKKSVSMFDDPFGWVYNQLSIGDDINAYNSAKASKDLAAGQIDKLNQLQQSTVVSQQQLESTITAGSAAAASQNVVLNAQKVANTDLAQAYATNAAGVQAALGLDRDKLNATSTAFGAQKAEEANRIALANLDMARKRFDMDAELKAREKEGESALLDTYNAGARSLYGPGYVDIPYGSKASMSLLTKMRAGGAAGAGFWEVYQKGAIVQASGGDARVIGTSPADSAATVFNPTRKVYVTPGQQPVVEFLDKVRSDIAAEMKANPGSIKTKEDYESAFNVKAREALAAQAKNPSDPSSLYNVGALNSYINSSDTLKNLPVVQKVLLPAIQSGVRLDNPDTVVQLGLSALESGKVSYSELLGMSQVFGIAVRANYSSRQLGSFGIQKSLDYPVRLTKNPDNVLTGKVTVDVSKPDDFGRFVNAAMSARVVPNAFGQTPDWRSQNTEE